jgi:mannose/fructose/N-acetylgalactosamine-specific phosphotransferase system component IIB
MEPQLFRIDDRLIHGQVILGWAIPLQSKCLLLCDDEIASSSWEKELYLSCVSNEIKALVLNVNKSCDYILNERNVLEKTIILVKSPKVVFKLIECGFKPNTINIGGLHFIGERKEYLPYVYMDQAEVKDLSDLENKNISIFCQDVPTGKKYPFRDLISQ